MTPTALLNSMKITLEEGKPFVVFAFPGDEVLQAYVQDSDELISAEGMMGKGFVFAPFAGSHSRVIIPPHKELKAPISGWLEEDSTERGVTEDGEVNASREEHIALVKKALNGLRSGVLEKVVLSRKIRIPRGDSDVFKVYQRLLSRYPDAFRYLWHHPKIGTWMGATPETLMRVNNGELQTMALAGTQPWKGTLDVSWGLKEQEEQAMVTRSILKSIAPYTTSAVAGETTTVKAAKLLHLLTPVRATLLPGEFQWDRIVEVLHPTPAVCGLPKEKAKEFILEHEGYDRGYYTGYLGPVDPEGEMRLFVNLRCMEVTPETYTIYVGGGITKDSDPAAEWQETVNKSQTMMAVL